MLKLAFALVRKDLLLTLFRGAGLVQSLLLGLLLFFMFSLSCKTGELIPAQSAATIFWLASVFCLILIFNTLFSYEESSKARTGLLLLPCPTAAIWLGKAISGFVLLFVSQCFFFPAAIIFLAQQVSEHLLLGLASLFLTDIGLVALGSLLGALAQGQAARESILSLLIFPLLIPLLLAGISLFAALFGDASSLEECQSWLSFVAAFDAVFLAAGMLLFRFIYTGED